MNAEEKKIDKLKKYRNAAIRAAEAAAYAYFCALPVGADKIDANTVFNNVRTSTRDGVSE